MEAGREMDARIAEKVMGRTNVRFTENNQGQRRELLSDDPKNLYAWVIVPYYSTDIAAAWQVVKNMQSRKWIVDINASWDGTCDCQINADNGEIWAVVGESDDVATAPLAICLAALKAVGNAGQEQVLR